MTKTILSSMLVIMMFAVAMLFTTMLQGTTKEPVPEKQEIVPGHHFVKE